MQSDDDVGRIGPAVPAVVCEGPAPCPHEMRCARPDAARPCSQRDASSASSATWSIGRQRSRRRRGRSCSPQPTCAHAPTRAGGRSWPRPPASPLQGQVRRGGGALLPPEHRTRLQRRGRFGSTRQKAHGRRRRSGGREQAPRAGNRQRIGLGAASGRSQPRTGGRKRYGGCRPSTGAGG